MIGSGSVRGQRVKAIHPAFPASGYTAILDLRAEGKLMRLVNSVFMKTINTIPCGETRAEMNPESYFLIILLLHAQCA